MRNIAGIRTLLVAAFIAGASITAGCGASVVGSDDGDLINVGDAANDVEPADAGDSLEDANSLDVRDALDDANQPDGDILTDTIVPTDDGTPTTPSVVSNTPLDEALNVSTNGNASATFSEEMDMATLTAETFTVTFGDAGTLVEGTVAYANLTAAFWPTMPLSTNTTFTATITTGAKSVAGIALLEDHVWTFTTGETAIQALPVDLGTAGNYVILAKSAISTVPTSAITGDLGLSPAAATFITEFSLTADSTNVFSTSTQVTGKVYAANYEPPTPANLTTAVADMELAFTDAAGRAPDVTELGAGSIGGMTIPAGVYKWASGLLIPSDITLDGNATDVWIFQISGIFTMSNATNVFLTGGALPQNVFWQVAGLVDLGTTAHCEGVILSQTAITLRTGASVNGRLLAQTAVSLQSNIVVEPTE